MVATKVAHFEVESNLDDYYYYKISLHLWVIISDDSFKGVFIYRDKKNSI